ncbi:MAG: glycosyltransferase [Thermoplasmata archaeon]
MEPVRRRPGAVTVIVTVLRDARVRRTLESLAGQHRLPERVIVDDGGGPETPVRPIAGEFERRDPRFIWLDAPGTIAESRNLALALVDTQFVAFLDADEIAPPEWLDEILAPLADPTVGFVGGPTPALPGTSRSRGVRYYDAYLRRFYDAVASQHPTSLPMGNSAWRMEVFDRVGTLDAALYSRGSIGNEDQDIAVRAERAGWVGRYAPRASVGHDFSDLSTTSILAKQSRYALGGWVAYRRLHTTYEASSGRLAPYVALPAIAVAGAILLAVPGLTLIAAALLAIGLGGLGALALALTVEGRRWEPQYPGMRYRSFEILRRWATLVGALRGLLRYGWSGRRGSSGGASGKP